MQEQTEPTTRTELNAENERAWVALQALVARHTEADLTTLHDAAGWTSKDHLAHLTAWLRSVVLPAQEGTSRWEALGVSEAVFAARMEDEWFAINAAIRQQHAGESLSAVLADLQSVVELSQALIETSSDADLQKPIDPCNPADGAVTVFQLLNGDGWEHFDLHRGYIVRILGAIEREPRPTDTMEELLSANEGAWSDLQALIDRHSADELTTARDAAGWTSKDHLAHLAAWESGVLHVLRDGWPQWQGTGVSAELFSRRRDDDFFTINEEIRHQNADRPLDDVVAGLGSVHEAMQETIRALGEAGLQRPVDDFRHDGTTLPVIDWIPGDSCDHYDEHRGYIARMLGEA